MWKNIEKWGKNNPVKLGIFAAIVGLLLGAVPAGTQGYNLGFYAGARTADERWQSLFAIRVKTEVKEQLIAECTKAVSSVNDTCQSSIRRLEAGIKSRDAIIASREAQIEQLTTQALILDLHENFVANANAILGALLSAREKKDSDAEKQARDRIAMLLQRISEMHQTYTEWSKLFNDVVTELTSRIQRGEQISSDEMLAFLRGFVVDSDQKRKVIQNQVDFANKIKRSKF